MLTERERNGMHTLLEKMPTEELGHLTNTVTNRLITVQNREEASKAIVSYSDNAEQFLRRKLVKRDLLFCYLADHDVTVSPSSDKSTIIAMVLAYWQSGTRPQITNGPSEGASNDDFSNSSQESTGSSVEVFHLSQEQCIHSDENTSSSSGSTPWSQELAQQFSVWFFSQLGLLHPSRSVSGASEWGPQHFLPDAYLKLCVIRGYDRHLESFEGAELVAKRLACLVTEEHLLFNPNQTPEGTKGSSEPHGLVMAAVKGTIHQTDTCVGLFEQNFGLVRDPLAENNWKIKFVNLQIKCTTRRQSPSLGASSNVCAVTT